MTQIKIRFNTEKEKKDGALPPWRVIIDGIEHLAEKVTIKTESWTSEDEISDGRVKWHISCRGEPAWDEARRECTINGPLSRAKND